MISIIDREARLVAFLRSHFPQHTIVPTLQRFGQARSTELVRSPEIRVLFSGITSASVVRWTLQFVEGSLGISDQRRVGPTGILPSAGVLHNALKTPPDLAAYRTAGGRIGERDDAADLWEEIIEEAFTPAGRAAQALFARSVEYAAIEEEIDAGTNNFGAVEPFGEAASLGDSLAIFDDDGYQFLGRVAATTPALITEFATTRTYSEFSTLFLLSEGVTSLEAGTEARTHTPAEFEALLFSMSGARSKRLLGPRRSHLGVQWDLTSETNMQDWERYLRGHASRATFILVCADLSLVAASLAMLKTTGESAGGHGSMTADFTITPISDMADFAEGTP